MKLRPIPKVLVVPAMIVTAMSQAHAGLISTSGGTSGFAAANANIVGYEPIGVVNATLMLSAPAELTYTYVGKKAAWNNEFVAVGQFGEHTFEAAMAVAGDSFTFRQATSGALNFSLLAAGGAKGSFVNGQGGSHADIGVLLRVLSATSALIAFDDGGGGPDGDFDDLVVRIDARAVPVQEPASLALLTTGLAVTMLRKRKKRSPPAVRS